MSKLKLLKQVPLEIAQILAADEIIQRLIYNDDPSALDHPIITPVVGDPLQTMLDERYISFYPLTETGIENITRNTFLIINAEDFNLDKRDNNISLRGNIYLSTDENHYLLTDNKIRVLELADRIVNLINDIKLSSAGILSVYGIHYVIYSDFRIGYKISFEIKDQEYERVEF